MVESDRLLSDCMPFKGVPRVQIPLSPPFFYPPHGIITQTKIKKTAKSHDFVSPFTLSLSKGGLPGMDGDNGLWLIVKT